MKQYEDIYPEFIKICTDHGYSEEEAKEIWKEAMDETEPIDTNCNYPPIPTRKYDWTADRGDPEGITGWGETEDEAIIDLFINEYENKR